ncbi:MAG: DUF983 domain-containing protein [Gemmatimonadota bacterium]
MRRRRDLFLRALRLHCPACGGGPVFVTWFKMCPSCPSCGINFDREPEGGYWVGSNTINLFATEFTFAVAFVGTLIETWPSPPWELLTWGGMALMVLLPILFYPFSKTVFIAVDLTFRPDEPHDYVRPSEPLVRPTGKRAT